MAKGKQHEVVVMDEGEGDEIVAEAGSPGGSERGWKWKAKMILIAVVAATVLRYIDKPFASVVPQYPIVDNVSTYYNWAYDHSIGFIASTIYSFGKGQVSGSVSLPTFPTEGLSQAPVENAPAAMPVAQAPAAAPAPQNAEPTRQCADWRQCIGDFNQVRGHLEWRVAQDASQTVYCVWQPAIGDRWNVTGYVFGLDDTRWGDYYNANHMAHPANDTYTGNPEEAIRQYDQTCDSKGIQRPVVQAYTPTPVPQVAVQAQPAAQENSQPQFKVEDITNRFGPAISGATGLIMTTKIQHLCLYVNQMGDTPEGIVARLGLTDIGAYGYYAQNSAHYAGMNDGYQGLYFQSQAAIECH